uniref:Bestrophin homolog n=1 Tax=Timema bartmani TaxID=61472 RepID=A0A7R9EN75_9NEOP|nr:unnamed protein product [Timema bartmani]
MEWASFICETGPFHFGLVIHFVTNRAHDVVVSASDYESGGSGSILGWYLGWKGSVYKLIWRDLLAYLCLYFAISLAYRFALADDQKSAICRSHQATFAARLAHSLGVLLQRHLSLTSSDIYCSSGLAICRSHQATFTARLARYSLIHWVYYYSAICRSHQATLTARLACYSLNSLDMRSQTKHKAAFTPGWFICRWLLAAASSGWFIRCRSLLAAVQQRSVN